ncbi:unnamed protein product [Linum trigynum]|uniref:Uncharacterized protein n=1 Tax=Linum trigynum TaxID=586398 RepID=A0AAV2G128_9ROSI
MLTGARELDPIGRRRRRFLPNRHSLLSAAPMQKSNSAEGKDMRCRLNQPLVAGSSNDSQAAEEICDNDESVRQVGTSSVADKVQSCDEALSSQMTLKTQRMAKDPNAIKILLGDSASCRVLGFLPRELGPLIVSSD